MQTAPKSPRAKVQRSRLDFFLALRSLSFLAVFFPANDLLVSPAAAQQETSADEVLLETTESTEFSPSQNGDDPVPDLIRLDPLKVDGVYPPVVTALAASADGKWLVAAGDDHAIRVVERATGVTHRVLEGHLDWVQAVAILEDSKTILSCSNDGTLRTWSLDSEPQQSRILYSGSIALMCLALAPDNQSVAVGGFGNQVRIHNVITGDLIRELTCECTDQRTLAFSKDGLQLACAGRDGVLRIWELTTPIDKPLIPLEQKLHNGRIRAVSFSEDGTIVSTVAEDRRFVRYRTYDGQILVDQKIPGGKLMAMVPIDSQAIAIAGADSTIRIVDSMDGKEIHRLVGHDGSVAILLRSGNHLISSSYDTIIRFWNLERAMQHDLAPYEHPVSARYVDSGVSESIR